ncbi:MAG: ATP-binding protein [Verrucomicrobiia bacterium]
MITRDIELQDAILDLLDNCIDGIRRIGAKGGHKPYAGRYAHITFDETHFSIEDNCGGIPLDIAKTSAFRMGRPADAKDPKKGSIGVYGIGMKRAIFKMGENCVVHSHTKGATFEVEIDKHWLEDDNNWKLEFKTVTAKLKKHGTRITVTDLRKGIKDQLAKGSHFEKEVFPKAVQAAYSLLIEKGFEVKVNGEVIAPDLPSLLWESPGPENKTDLKIRPYIYKAHIDGVDISLAVGFYRPLASTSEEDSAADRRYDSDKAGWTVVCNDRVVLSCDQTAATGWGRAGVPKYHTQFIAIAGYVEFYSQKHPSLLPMTTTKRGVDLSSKIYDTVRERMQEGIKYFTKFTNDWKGREDKQKAMFSRAQRLSLPQVCSIAEKHLRFSKIRGDPHQQHVPPHLPQQPKEITEKRISFMRPIRQIKEVSVFLFDKRDAKLADIGAECFDRTLKQAQKK